MSALALRNDHSFDADAAYPAVALVRPRRLVDVDALPASMASLLDPLNRVEYLTSFRNESHEITLRQPLRMEVTSGEDVAFAVYAPAVGLGGAGDTKAAAVADLAQSLWLLWEGLRSGDAPLDESAENVLGRLRRFLSE